MYGIRIFPFYRYPPESLTDAERAVQPSRRLVDRQGSDFSLYFASILPALERLVWFADEQAFNFPLEWFFDDAAGKDTPFTLIDQRRTWIALECDGSTKLTIDPNWILQPVFVATYAPYVTRYAVIVPACLPPSSGAWPPPNTRRLWPNWRSTDRRNDSPVPPIALGAIADYR